MRTYNQPDFVYVVPWIYLTWSNLLAKVQLIIKNSRQMFIQNSVLFGIAMQIPSPIVVISHNC